MAWSWSQHSPHTGVARCDCSHTLVSSFAQLYTHEANIPSRTAWTSCKACSAVVTHLNTQWESNCSCQALPAQRQIITRQVSGCSRILRFVLSHKSCYTWPVGPKGMLAYARGLLTFCEGTAGQRELALGWSDSRQFPAECCPEK